MPIVEVDPEFRFRYLRNFTEADIEKINFFLKKLSAIAAKDSKMRVTQHSGRTRRTGGSYTAKHNDRNFDLNDADHIDPVRTKKNINWYWCQNKEPGLSFDESELKFYNERYGEQLDNTNFHYQSNYHPERVVSMDKWRKQKQHAPEEVIQQIGDVENNPGPDILLKCWKRYLYEMEKWNNLHGNHMHILNWSLHQDERGAPHIHFRRTWDYYNSENQQIELGQDKALEAAGVPLPFPDKPRSRKNNRKMTFDKEMRTVWINICKEFGLDIETNPLPENEVGMSLNQKIRKNEMKRKQQAQEAAEIILDIFKNVAEETQILDEQKKEFELEKENLTIEKQEAEKILEQKAEIERTEHELNNEKVDWEESKSQTEIFIRSIDEKIKYLPKLEKMSDIGSIEKIENQIPIQKKGTFVKESYYEYGYRIAQRIWNYVESRYNELQSKCSKLLQTIKDLKRENLIQKNRISQLEKENYKLSHEVGLIVDDKVERRLESILEREKKPLQKEIERLNGIIFNFAKFKHSKDGHEIIAENGILDMAERCDNWRHFDQDQLRDIANDYDKYGVSDNNSLQEAKNKQVNDDIGWS